MNSPTPRNRGRGERRIEVKAWAAVNARTGRIDTERVTKFKALALVFCRRGYRVERVTIRTGG